MQTLLRKYHSEYAPFSIVCRLSICLDCFMQTVSIR